MSYFSEIKNRKVYTDDGLFVGKLVDLVFTFTDVAQVTKLLVKSSALKNPVHVPVNDLISIENPITISKAYVDYELQENELYVGKNLIDKQIIDIEGRKVVRVNDAVIEVRRSKNIYITGVDIGAAAILRWFKLEDIFRSVGKL